MRYRVLISCPNLLNTIDRYRESFRQHDIEIDTPDIEQQLSEEELLAIIDQYDGVIAGDDEFTGRVLDRARKLRILAKWGIGIDNIDLESAKRNSIPVVNTPGVFSNEVADVAIGYVILLGRQLHRINEEVRKGNWYKPLGETLSGKTLGIIGVGSIGSAIAKRGDALGMNVVGYDIVGPNIHQQGHSVVTMLDQPSAVLNISDYVLLSCNLTDENYHLINSDTLSRMKDGVRIINVSRGPLIDEAALVAALETGKVGGAALDVFETEPLGRDNPLRQYDNVIFGSHNGSNTLEAVLRVNEIAISNLYKGLGISE